jgi:hypothetical protein
MSPASTRGAVLSRRSKPTPLRALVCGGALVASQAFSLRADAHFVLGAPPSYDTIDPISGLPEKLGPCGNEDPQMLTSVVTAFQEGQSITITIDEVVFHPGHYRVALAMVSDHMQASFPDDPIPTPGLTSSGTMICAGGDTSACGSVPIENPPVFPVIADNLFEHCANFAGPQSATITLPAGVTCDKCTLQVLEFMSDHGPNVPGGCFYHHCADITIAAKAVVVGGGKSGGCSFSKAAGGRGGLWGALGALALGLGWLRARARRSSP